MRKQVVDTAIGESTPLEDFEAAYAFYSLDKEDREHLWDYLFTRDEREVIIRGHHVEERAEAGTQEAHKQLSADQQEVVFDLQTASSLDSSLEGTGVKGRDARGLVEDAAEKMIGMSEEQRDQIKDVVPESAGKAFKKALEKVKAPPEEKKEKGQNEGQDGSQSKEKGEEEGKDQASGRDAISRSRGGQSM